MRASDKKAGGFETYFGLTALVCVAASVPAG
jgi:hypothetical protein